MKTEFTKEYFIKKFEAIPEKNWSVEVFKVTISTVYELYQKKCALGHCNVSLGMPLTPEAKALSLLFRPDQDKENISTIPVILVNDDINQFNFKGETPKQRILNFLYSL